MIRIYPYTTCSLVLQSGHFDHSDRLFYSVNDTWYNCLNSASDVKELIPEFYYDSQFLYNKNDLDFGVRQDGNKISFFKFIYIYYFSLILIKLMMYSYLFGQNQEMISSA